MTLRELFDYRETLVEIGNLPFEMKDSRKIVNFIEDVNDRFEKFEKIRIKRIKELGVLNGDKYSIEDPEIQSKYYKEIDEIINIETDIIFPDVVFDYEYFEFIKVKISPKALMIIKKIFKNK